MRVVAAILPRYPARESHSLEPVKVHLLERSQRVAIPAGRAFGLYADAANLEPMTPPWLHFRLTTRGR